MRAFADAMVNKGLLAAGYNYLNLDCAWQGSRDSNGAIRAGSFYPSGIKALAYYVHAKGLKFGIYTAPGLTTCDNKPGSQGHETQDVNTYASWGADYIKLDWCGADYSATGAANIAQTLEKRHRGVRAANGPEHQRRSVHGRGALGKRPREPVARGRRHLRHLAQQDRRSQSRLRSLHFHNRPEWHLQLPHMSLDYLIPYSGSGHWGDPDMLQVGNPGLTLAEAQTHFSIWAKSAATVISELDTINGLGGVMLLNLSPMLTVRVSPSGAANGARARATPRSPPSGSRRSRR